MGVARVELREGEGKAKGGSDEAVERGEGPGDEMDEGHLQLAAAEKRGAQGGVPAGSAFWASSPAR